MRVRLYVALLIIMMLMVIPVISAAECSSDFECGIGNKCVKPPLNTYGTCMKKVDEYGLPTYDLPSADSVGPNMNISGDCDYDTDCPIGFRCNREYKACVRR